VKRKRGKEQITAIGAEDFNEQMRNPKYHTTLPVGYIAIAYFEVRPTASSEKVPHHPVRNTLLMNELFNKTRITSRQLCRLFYHH
jgi:hypothetical protein